jgi:hypothetical protein
VQQILGDKTVTAPLLDQHYQLHCRHQIRSFAAPNQCQSCAACLQLTCAQICTYTNKYWLSVARSTRSKRIAALNSHAMAARGLPTALRHADFVVIEVCCQHHLILNIRHSARPAAARCVSSFDQIINCQKSCRKASSCKTACALGGCSSSGGSNVTASEELCVAATLIVSLQ